MSAVPEDSTRENPSPSLQHTGCSLLRAASWGGEVQHMECWNSFSQEAANAATVEMRTSYWKITESEEKWLHKLQQLWRQRLWTPNLTGQLLRNHKTSVKPFQDLDNTTQSSNQSETPLIALTQHLIAWEKTAATLSAAPTLPATSTPKHPDPSPAFHTTLPHKIQFIFMFLIWQSRTQPNV